MKRSSSRRNFLKSSALGFAALSGKHSSAQAGATVDALIIRRSIPIRHKVDIFIAGGGPAGVAAAVTAARQGRSVFLAERQNCFGGMGTAGLLPTLLYMTDGKNYISGGMGREIQTLMEKAGGLYPPEIVPPDPSRLWFAYRSEVLKRVYDALIVNAGVQFSFDTQVVDIEQGAGRITSAILSAKSGLFAVTAKLFIDATGDGDLAVWAGAEFEKGDESGNMMAGTLCSAWSDIDWKTVAANRHHEEAMVNRYLVQAIKDGLFSQADPHLPGIFRTGDTLGGGNVGHTFSVDGTDERSVSLALVQARKSLQEYEQFYKTRLKGYETMQLIATGAMLGIRETRRITGDYVLNIHDFMKRAVFADEIGRFAYPVDVHAAKPGQEAYNEFARDFEKLRYEKGENYGIPYRVLTPKKLSNVLVAGRCVSTDRAMLGSLRVQSGCFITGQAAGMAAALAVRKNTDSRGIAVRELQYELKKIGAFLPNFS
jgi:hypothetical protein